MHQFYRSRTSLLAVAALGCMLVTGGAAQAQTLQIFDEAPSIEQLRTIMIPESRGGLTRSIVLLHPGATAGTGATQVAAVQPVDPPAAPPMKAEPAEAAAAVSGPAHAPPTPAKVMAVAVKVGSEDAAHQAGIVGFHINFALDSATLPATATVFVDRMAELMKQEPQVKLRVEGHTDALGTAGYNQQLSERRAAAVADYLVRHCGIAAERLVIKGMGMTEPMTQDPYDGQNRRVQFVRIG
jgi:outer membrane protein OmpA-like peptidoglycan-associated protein